MATSTDGFGFGRHQHGNERVIDELITETDEYIDLYGPHELLAGQRSLPRRGGKYALRNQEDTHEG